jgi:RND family efflux transporter MFP subunit
MAFHQHSLVIFAATLLGGIYLTDAVIASAQGPDNINEQLKAVVEATHVEGAASPFELSPLEVAEVRLTTLVERLQVTGEIRATRHVNLRARIGGRIIHSSIREGQAVKAGQVLIRFETSELQAALKPKEADREGAMAQMILAMQSLNRVEQLVSKGISSQEQLDKAKSEVAASKARLDSLIAQVDVARTAMQDTEILAPFDGLVSKLSVDQGTQIAANAELLSLVDVNEMEARVLVSTQDVSRVIVGQSVELQVDSFQDRLIEGEVTRISPVTDDGSRSVAVHIRVPDDGYQFKGGMFVHGSILVRQAKDALAVPIAALQRDEKNEYVLKLLDGLLVRQSVTILSRWDNGETAEVSGLAPGDLIVRTPLAELQPGVAIIVAQVG